MQKDPSKGYLFFTAKEKRGTLFILAAVAAVYLSAKFLYPLAVKDAELSLPATLAAADSLKTKQDESSKKEFSYTKKEYTGGYNRQTPIPGAERRGELFFFDPNTLAPEGWQKLGVRDKTIATIQNYLAKGGKFREASDLLKIWGLREDEKKALLPYVRISESFTAHKVTYGENDFKPYEKKPFEKKAPGPVDINSGDSAAFESLPGIGPGFAKRIVKFRDKLGGFYKAEQVSETFGLPDSVYQKIRPLLKVSGTELRKININTATGEELKAHPYIRWQSAKIIIEFRKQHGDFKSAADLQKIMVLDRETIAKILPYLTF